VGKRKEKLADPKVWVRGEPFFIIIIIPMTSSELLCGMKKTFRNILFLCQFPPQKKKLKDYRYVCD